MELFNFIEKCPPALTSSMIRKSFRTGQDIPLSANNGNYVYILLTGQVRLVSEIEGKDVVVAHISAPEIFGEVEYFVNQPIITKVEAETFSDALRLEADLFMEWIKQDFEFNTYVMRTLASQVKHFSTLQAATYLLPVEQQIENVLKNVIRNGESEVEKSYLSKQIYATSQGLNSALKKLQEQGKISVQQNRIFVLQL